MVTRENEFINNKSDRIFYQTTRETFETIEPRGKKSVIVLDLVFSLMSKGLAESRVFSLPTSKLDRFQRKTSVFSRSSWSFAQSEACSVHLCPSRNTLGKQRIQPSWVSVASAKPKRWFFTMDRFRATRARLSFDDTLLVRRWVCQSKDWLTWVSSRF